MKIKFRNDPQNNFYRELKIRVNQMLIIDGLYKKRLYLLYGKTIFY